MTDAIRTALLREAHRLVAEAADAGLARTTAGAARTKPAPIVLTYPPGDGRSEEHVLTPLEASALAKLSKSEAARSGLRKLLREAAAGPLFNLFCLLDGVADPETWEGDVWSGADLVPPREDEHREMLHDAFLDSYWAFVQE